MLRTINRKVLSIIIVAIVMISIISSLSYMIYHASCGGSSCSVSLSLYTGILNSIKPRVYLSEKASSIIKADLLTQIGFDAKIFHSTLPDMDKEGLIILDVKDLSGKTQRPASILKGLIRATNNIDRVAFMILNTKRNETEAKKAFEIMLKYFGSRGIELVLPVEKYDFKNKLGAPQLDRRIFTAQALAFTINPNGIIVIESLTDIPQTLILLLKWSNLIPEPNTTQNKISMIVGSHSIKSIKYFKFIGYIGWIKTNFTGSVCHETTGYMAVKVDYYYTSATTPSGKVYHAWLVHVEHSAKGYRTTCCNPWPFCSTINHYPKVFISKVNWRTTDWPGQVLDDWQPKNTGTAQTISFTVTWQAGVSVGKDAHASVSYSAATSLTSPNNPYFEWYDISDPADGVAAAKHIVKLPKNYDISKLNNVLFTVEPTSIGFLDQDKDGGCLPMIISQTFKTILNTGDTVTISFNAHLYQNRVYKA